MFSNAYKCVLGAIAAAGLSIGSVPAEATSVILSHNGSPGPVPVTFNCSIDPTNAIQPAEDCTKDWTAFPSQPHVIQWNASQGTVIEDIINNTGIPWTDYHWDLVFTGENTGLFTSFTTSASVGYRLETMDSANNGELVRSWWLYFDVPFTPTQGQFVTTIEFDATFVNGGSVEIRQYPTVPEPASLALMGLGLAAIGYRRHRSKKAT